ncbi:hypothetical protein EVAR_49371_1 [Eumeta japonica]|uniref:Uncharacterized protein n=1 Tax=Eumeta variegata TaxID=151549 RepID=A0A4C1XU18_EUMVA|nr:hypothetical protein EVAR_49371_1 [Eumeta japonica]
MRFVPVTVGGAPRPRREQLAGRHRPRGDTAPRHQRARRAWSLTQGSAVIADGEEQDKYHFDTELASRTGIGIKNGWAIVAQQNNSAVVRASSVLEYTFLWDVYISQRNAIEI